MLRCAGQVGGADVLVAMLGGALGEPPRDRGPAPREHPLRFASYRSAGLPMATLPTPRFAWRTCPVRGQAAPAFVTSVSTDMRVRLAIALPANRRPEAPGRRLSETSEGMNYAAAV